MLGRLDKLSEIVTQLDELEGVMSDMLTQQQNVEVTSYLICWFSPCTASG